MTNRGPLHDSHETPEDVAALYSWANLHGAKYRDFSDARAQAREKARLRVQQAIEEEQARTQHLAQADRTIEAQHASEAALLEEETRRAERDAQETQEPAAQWRPERPALPPQASRQSAWQPLADRFAAFVVPERAPTPPEHGFNAPEPPAIPREPRSFTPEPEHIESNLEREFRPITPEPEPYAHEFVPMPFEPTSATRDFVPAPSDPGPSSGEFLSARSESTDIAHEFIPMPQELTPSPTEVEPAQSVANPVQREFVSAPPISSFVPTGSEPKHPEPVPPVRNFVPMHPEPAAPPPRDDVSMPTEPIFPTPEFRPASVQVPQQPAPVEEKLAYRPAPPIPPQRPVASQPQPAREQGYVPPRSALGQVDARESTGRPAWLTPERPGSGGQQPPPSGPEDTLQGSRERLASRWYALRGVFEGAGAPQETAPVAPPGRAPVVAVFSLAGGVGKTSLAATLGRALSARGERVLLVDTAPYGLMPFYFGAHDQRPGVLRTFSPPGTSGDAPIQMLTFDPESQAPEVNAQEALTSEISKYLRGVSRVIVDLATASGATSRPVIKMAPLVLVPMIPDMNSVVSVSSIDSFFQHNQQAGTSVGKPLLPHYVLNQFDPSLPLHLDIREVLREQLGERLLPFVLRRNPVVSEALAEGMTVMDYAPNSSVAEDFGNLAGWVKSQSAPASSNYRGVRWSER